MKLLIISYKECFQDSQVPSGFVTNGGFPFQIQKISELFDQTRLLVIRKKREMTGLMPIQGKKISVLAFDPPCGRRWKRKIGVLGWFIKNFSVLWKEFQKADVIHPIVPGDIGFLGLILALIQRKKIFVRHCSTWGTPKTCIDIILLWLLRTIANKKNVVFATGYSKDPPENNNSNIEWIFSTSISSEEWQQIKTSKSWSQGQPLELVSVARLDKDKNIQAIIKALPLIQDKYPHTKLHILGEGHYHKQLLILVDKMGMHEHVIFYGQCSHKQVLERLAQSHIFIFPTRVSEGFPKALIEAMACGLPVLSSSVSMIPKLIIESESGYLLKTADEKEVADCVLKLLSDEKELKRMGMNARKSSKNYNLEKWQQSIQQKLEQNWEISLSTSDE